MLRRHMEQVLNEFVWSFGLQVSSKPYIFSAVLLSFFHSIYFSVLYGLFSLSHFSFALDIT